MVWFSLITGNYGIGTMAWARQMLFCVFLEDTFFWQLRQRIDLLASMPLNSPLIYAVAHTTNFVGSEWGVGVDTH